jgi:hypothetical protein
MVETLEREWSTVEESETKFLEMLKVSRRGKWK